MSHKFIYSFLKTLFHDNTHRILMYIIGPWKISMNRLSNKSENTSQNTAISTYKNFHRPPSMWWRESPNSSLNPFLQSLLVLCHRPKSPMQFIVDFCNSIHHESWVHKCWCLSWLLVISYWLPKIRFFLGIEWKFFLNIIHFS